MSGEQSSGEQSKAFIRRYLDAFLAADDPSEVLDEYVADDELKQHVEFFWSAFPGYQVIAEDIIGDGDKVSVRAVFKGDHEGELMGILPTHKHVEVPFQIIYRISSGKIAEHWMSIDQMALMQQLGVAPSLQPAH